MGWRFVRWCGVAALLIGSIATAKAEISPPSAHESANDLRQKAFKASEAGRDEEAMRLFRAAWELRKNYFDICVLATIQLEHHQWRNAAESYTLCKKAQPDMERITQEKTLERELKKARDHVGTITVTANVPGAEVFLDSKIIGKIPLEQPIFVDPGWYTVEVRAPGYASNGMAFKMWAGHSEMWDVQLEPSKVDAVKAAQEPAPPALKPAAAPPISAPIVRSSPSASPAPSRLPSPKEHLSEASDRAPAPLLIAGMSIGIVGVGVAAPSLVAAFVAQNQASNLTDDLLGSNYKQACLSPDSTSSCLEIARLNGRSDAFMTVGLGGLAMCATGLALITYDVFRSSSPKKQSSIHGAIVAAPGGGALRVNGSF